MVFISYTTPAPPWAHSKIRPLSISPWTRVPAWVHTCPRHGVGSIPSPCVVRLTSDPFGLQLCSSSYSLASPVHDSLDRSKLTLLFWYSYVASAYNLDFSSTIDDFSILQTKLSTWGHIWVKNSQNISAGQDDHLISTHDHFFDI